MIESIALLAVLLFLGYLLGIVGFFRAGSAKREIGELRAQLAQEIARRVATEQSVPPTPGTQPSETAQPETPMPAAPTAAEPPKQTSRPKPPPLRPRPSPPAASPRPARAPRRDLESVLTMRWAAWGGAVALLLAGVFLVRYAAEQGLLGPATRCGVAAVLGLALLAGAEWLRRRDVPAVEGEFAVDQAPPALAAGGIAILFGAAYGAGPFYDLLSPFFAFASMAAVSFVGMAAALRFGPLTAAVGIFGAFVAPALVQTPSPSLVGLFAYLALATAAAYEVVWRTAWIWLGFAVAIAGAIWVVFVAIMAPTSEIWAAAVYVPVAAFLGLLLPDAAVDDRKGRVLAFGQLAIVATAGLFLEAGAPGAATRLALLALTPLAVWKGIESPRLDRLPWLAAAAGLGMLLLWDGVDIESVALADTSTFLLAACAFAAVQAAVGLVLERRAPEAVRWSALAAAVPVLTLAIAYARVGRMEPDATWGLAGLLLAFALVATTRRSVTAGALPSAGAHAAGAVAALALACGMTLRNVWLSDALALILPGLAWIESKVDLPALRKVALVVAAVTLLLLWRWLADAVSYPADGTLPAGPFASYAIPALAFFAASRMFRARRDDAAVATLEAGAMGLGALYVTLQIRVWFGHGRFDAPFGFDEAATIMLAAVAQAFAYDRIAARAPRPTVTGARAILALVAALFAVGLLLANPMTTNARVTAVSLLIAYFVPAAVAGVASLAPERAPMLKRGLAGFAVLDGFAWTTLQVRQAFHPEAMEVGPAAPVLDAELWAWSGAWLVYGLALMILGIWLRAQPLRLAALALIGLVCVKAFLWDMSDLTGLWRVASFLGLGLALIGLAAMHRRFVLPRQTGEAGA